jgi:nucleotide-binding universal stress UspA family protein
LKSLSEWVKLFGKVRKNVKLPGGSVRTGPGPVGRDPDDSALVGQGIDRPNEAVEENGWRKRRRPMIPQIKKILYATDLSKNSSYAFLYAIDMARKHDGKIVILHAIEPLPKEVKFVDMLERIENKERKEMVEQVQKLLQEFCKKTEAHLGSPCVQLVTKFLVPRGHPPEEILNAAEKEGCDAIVLGTHGKGFLAHAFLGSVSSSVLHRTRKPVFIIPLPSEETKIDWDGI